MYSQCSGRTTRPSFTHVSMQPWDQRAWPSARASSSRRARPPPTTAKRRSRSADQGAARQRSEEHTSELQSRGHLVCRLLLEKKKKDKNYCGLLVSKLH